MKTDLPYHHLLYSQTFTAIDFETANRNRNSACSPLTVLPFHLIHEPLISVGDSIGQVMESFIRKEDIFAVAAPGGVE